MDPTTIRVAADLAVDCVAGWPHVRSWVVDATRYHEAGASDVEELACATATGVAYLRLLVEAGLEVAQALGQLEFRFAATADQFATLAKLRAARQLWARVAQQLGVPSAGGQRQHVLTSRAMLTRYDPWVNLLRNTTACFAAGAGGADAVTVEPHDMLVDSSAPSDLGRRLARNTQLLLLEESHLARVLDPGGGSWYVEWLTDAMAQRAWEWFRQIEASGGMATALASGQVQGRIQETWARRADRLARRLDTVVGVSDFPNLDDRVPPPTETGPAAEVAGLPRRRYAEPFEALRVRTDDHERATGEGATVLLVRLGPVAAFTARATYAKSFFEAAGLRTATCDADGAVPAAVLDIVREGAIRVACLCSSDPVYAAGGATALARLATCGLGRLYAAARPGGTGDRLLAGGADELIYAGCNALDALDRALDVMGVP